MKDPLFLQVCQFLQNNLDPQKPILLAYSGGIDSFALLHLLLECKKKFLFDLHVAHVDHSWRGESSKEARALQSQIESLGLPFYIETLSFEGVKNNWEEVAREKRIEFFKKIYEEKNMQALLFAHHADDQAETVLKRIFEGSDLRFLGGMRQTSSLRGMTLWRPMLRSRKKDLCSWLEKKDLQALVDDSTNRDTKYLRARFRENTIPLLEEQFGKGISLNLVRLGARAQEVEDYVRRKVDKYFSTACEGVFGVYYDLNPLYPLEKLEVGFFIKEVSEKEGLFLSYEQRETLETGLLTLASNCHVSASQVEGDQKKLFVDRGRLFVIREDIPSFTCHTPLSSLELQSGKWKLWLSCKVQDKSREKRGCDWKDVWKGKVYAHLPQKKYELISDFRGSLLHKSRQIHHFWNDNKVPAFFRQILPCIVEDQRVAYDLLTGKPSHLQAVNEEMLFISLEIKNIEN
ncbi:MAG: tRNA lysidine(34) synthetase TilS [Chlamydiae bacterium]|nr:tRNA lysidine(34) synthetase TilS [Chlamydiota bacterium]